MIMVESEVKKVLIRFCLCNCSLHINNTACSLIGIYEDARGVLLLTQLQAFGITMYRHAVHSQMLSLAFFSQQ